MKPLMDQLNRVKDLPIPEFGSFLAWEARAAMAARANGDLNPNDPLRSQSGYGSTPMPFLGETKVITTYTSAKIPCTFPLSLWLVDFLNLTWLG